MVRPFDESRIPAIYDFDDIPVHDAGDGIERRAFRGMDTLLSFSSFEPHSSASRHSHPWEQLTFVLEGEATFYVDDEPHEVSEGDLFMIPPNYHHSVETGDSSCTLFTANPLREDRLDLTGYQDEFA